MSPLAEDAPDAALAAAHVHLQEAALLPLEEPVLPHRSVHRGEPGGLPRPHLHGGTGRCGFYSYMYILRTWYTEFYVLVYSTHICIYILQYSIVYLLT